MGNKGKRYDAEFKADAARLVKESGEDVPSKNKSAYYILSDNPKFFA